MKRKIFIVLTILSLLLTLTGVSVFAEEGQIEPSQGETPEVQEPSEPVIVYNVLFKYTSDSTAHAGITYETYSDSILNEVGFKIVEDLPIGHEIYDNPETAYIDGIRVNGNTVDSFKIPVTDANVAVYTVDLRIVYSEGVLGDIAKISDGTYDWSQLLANPVILFQLGYWALAIITVIIGLFTSIFGKKTKVKTADEISSSVTNAAEVALVKIKESVTETVIAEFTPVFQTILKDFENVVKAVTLSNSKSKDAPLALLDVLQETVNSTDVNALIDGIRKAIEEQSLKDSSTHADNVATLHAIATQEDAVPSPTSDNGGVKNDEPKTKSVF